MTRLLVGLLARAHGQALPMLIACMAVFSISVGSVMAFTSSTHWPASLIVPHTGQLWPDPPGDYNIYFGPEIDR